MDTRYEMRDAGVDRRWFWIGAILRWMREGWLGEDYIVVFPDDQVESISAEYGLGKDFADDVAIGLIGWDNFILRKCDGSLWRLPTVPQNTKYLKVLNVDVGGELEQDPRFVGKIKWYVKPLIFGGSAKMSENGEWISLEDHCKAVVYWNRIYEQAKNSAT